MKTIVFNCIRDDNRILRDLLPLDDIYACCAMRDLSIPSDNKLYVSESKDMILLLGNNNEISKANLIYSGDGEFDEDERDILKIMIDSAKSYLISSTFKLDRYLPCSKIGYGYFYHIQTKQCSTHNLDFPYKLLMLEENMSYLDEVASIVLSQKNLNEPADIIKQWIQKKAIISIACNSRQLIGVCVFSFYFDTPVINLIYVNPDFRLQKVAISLLNQTSMKLKEMNYNSFYAMSPYDKRRLYMKMPVIHREGWTIWKNQNI